MTVQLGIIGDVHARFDVLEQVLLTLDAIGCDGILLVGDLGSHDVGLARRRTPQGDAAYLRSITALFERIEKTGVPWAFVPGNHDLPGVPGDRNADHGVLDVAGLRVAGVGGAGPARFGFCYEWDEDDIRARTVPPCDVLLVHAPPARTPLDVLVNGEHVGSEAIRELALRHTGALVCGHIHEAGGVHQLGSCLCLNAGGLGRPHGKAQVGLLRLDAAWSATHIDLETGQRQSMP
jgi:Icc-related predicted phosphoesterase